MSTAKGVPRQNSSPETYVMPITTCSGPHISRVMARTAGMMPFSSPRTNLRDDEMRGRLESVRDAHDVDGSVSMCIKPGLRQHHYLPYPTERNHQDTPHDKQRRGIILLRTSCLRLLDQAKPTIVEYLSNNKQRSGACLSAFVDRP